LHLRERKKKSKERKKVQGNKTRGKRIEYSYNFTWGKEEGVRTQEMRKSGDKGCYGLRKGVENISLEVRNTRMSYHTTGCKRIPISVLPKSLSELDGKRKR